MGAFFDTDAILEGISGTVNEISSQIEKAKKNKDDKEQLTQLYSAAIAAGIPVAEAKLMILDTYGNLRAGQPAGSMAKAWSDISEAKARTRGLNVQSTKGLVDIAAAQQMYDLLEKTGGVPPYVLAQIAGEIEKAKNNNETSVNIANINAAVTRAGQERVAKTASEGDVAAGQRTNAGVFGIPVPVPGGPEPPPPSGVPLPPVSGAGPAAAPPRPSTTQERVAETTRSTENTSASENAFYNTVQKLIDGYSINPQMRDKSNDEKVTMAIRTAQQMSQAFKSMSAPGQDTSGVTSPSPSPSPSPQGDYERYKTAIENDPKLTPEQRATLLQALEAEFAPAR